MLQSELLQLDLLQQFQLPLFLLFDFQDLGNGKLRLIQRPRLSSAACLISTELGPTLTGALAFNPASLEALRRPHSARDQEQQP